MAVTAQDLAAFIGQSDDDLFVQACFTTAYEACTNHVGSQADKVPESAFDMAVLKAGSELYHAKNAPNGIAQFGAFDGAPIRIARDFMVAAYPILNAYLVVGF